MTKKVKLPNDYERMIPEYHKGSPVYAEHIVRYEGAVDLVRGKVVLDIASGSGYGTKLLASTAKKMYGVDVSEISISYAQENYAALNIEYIVGDGIKIPLPDASVDIVVSFETIEHIKDYEQFMVEVKRVLTQDGLLLLSTPNVVEFAEGNHFHLHEFEESELHSLIRKYFKNTKSYYQGTWLYNALINEAGLTKEWRHPIQTIHTAPITLNQCLYFYVLCSNRQISEKVVEVAATSGHWSEKGHQDYDKTLRNHIENQQKDLEFLSKELSRANDKFGSLQNQLNSATTEITSFKNHVLSLPYRATRKFKKR